MEFKCNITFSVPSMGVYNSDLHFKNLSVTKDRKISIFEIELPIESAGHSYVNGKKYKITTNEILCVKPGSERHSELPYKCFYVHLNTDNEDILMMLSEIPDLFLITDREKYKKIFEEMIEAYTFPKIHSDILIQSKLLELIYKMYHDSFRLNANSVLKNNMTIKKAIYYINEHFRENINLDTIAENVHMSKIYFRKQFIDAMGMSPHEYVLHQRISEAKKQLLVSSKPISDIAYNTGFSSQSYFNFVFKKETGTTPNIYRKKISDNYADTRTSTDVF